MEMTMNFLRFWPHALMAACLGAALVAGGLDGTRQ